METKQTCSICGKTLAPSAPEGLCPECLLQAGLGTGVDIGPDTATGAARPRFVPPKVNELAPLFPQLEILELIGQGGMGAVYKARQKQLDRFVALKVLPPSIGEDAAFAERFTREAKALAKLNHPGIVTLFEFGQVGHRRGDEAGSPLPALALSGGERFLYFFLMEFVDGVNLRQLLQAGRVSAREALAIVPQICDALQFAHDQGIVHRDIKPENILLDRRGRVKVADFGLAKLVGSDVPLTPSHGERVASRPGEGTTALTDAGKVMGTPSYMAPEQISHPADVDHRADIYALGVVFYQMLTGELPGQRIEPPSRKVRIDVRLDEIVLRALERQPEMRFQQASVMGTQVETVAEAGRTSENPVAAHPESSFSRTAIVGAGWIPFFFASAIFLLFEPRRLPFPYQYNLPSALAIILSLSGCFGTTILGWIAVSQIRRSRGRLYGMWLAVFDGLIFPLLAVVGFITLMLYRGTPESSIARAPVLILAAVIATFPAVLIVRRVWRAVNASPADTLSIPPSTPRRSNWVAWAVGLVLGWFGIVLLGVAATAVLSKRNTGAPNLANQPHLLRSFPTRAVVEAGLADPASPWAWNELRDRAQAGRITTGEAGEIVDHLTTWLRREHPQGYENPLFSIGTLLGELNRRQLVAETNMLAFLDAYCGSPSIQPLTRVRESDPFLQLRCHWRSPWLDQPPLGFELLNEMRVVRIDGRPVPFRSATGHNWNSDAFNGEIALLSLSPGQHRVQCEVESAWVATREMAGLASDTASADWPPTRRRWTRVSEAEFTVYAQAAEIVKLTDDPAFHPSGALSVSSIIIRPKSGRLTATVIFTLKPELEPPVSVEATLRLAGQSIPLGKLFAVKTVFGSSHTAREWTVDIEPLDPHTREAEIRLKPNPKAVEPYVGIDRIWGEEVVFSHVPLLRQDLPGARPLEASRP